MVLHNLFLLMHIKDYSAFSFLEIGKSFYISLFLEDKLLKYEHSCFHG